MFKPFRRGSDEPFRFGCSEEGLFGWKEKGGEDLGLRTGHRDPAKTPEGRSAEEKADLGKSWPWRIQDWPRQAGKSKTRAPLGPFARAAFPSSRGQRTHPAADICCLSSKTHK